LPNCKGRFAERKWIVGSGIHRLWLGSYEPSKMTLSGVTDKSIEVPQSCPDNWHLGSMVWPGQTVPFVERWIIDLCLS